MSSELPSQEKWDSMQRAAEFVAAGVFKSFELELAKRLGKENWEKIDEEDRKLLLWFYFIKERSMNMKGIQAFILGNQLASAYNMDSESIDKFLASHGYVIETKQPSQQEVGEVKIFAKRVIAALVKQFEVETGVELAEEIQTDERGLPVIDTDEMNKRQLLWLWFVKEFGMDLDYVERFIFNTVLRLEYGLDSESIDELLGPI